MKHFFNPKTQYDPEYVNVQAELWKLLSEDEQETVARTFRHLKNFIQVEISKAIINVINKNMYPDPRNWSSSFCETIFEYLRERLNFEISRRDTEGEKEF